jgi:hypothetical protein
MIRTLMAVMAFTAAPAISQAAAQPAPDQFGGVVVQAPPRDAYVIVLDVTGKDPAEVRKMIWNASWTACERAPRTGNAVEIRPTYSQWCATQAAWGAMQQFDEIVAKRRQGTTVDVASR